MDTASGRLGRALADKSPLGISSDNRFLAFGTNGKDDPTFGVRIYDVLEDRWTTRFSDPSWAAVRRAYFSPRGRYLIGAGNSAMYVGEISSGRTITQLPANDNRNLKFSASIDRLLVQKQDSALNDQPWVLSVIDLATGRQLASLKTGLRWSYDPHAQFSPDGRRLAFFRADPQGKGQEQVSVCLWSDDAAEPVRLDSFSRFDSDRQGLVFSVDSRRLLIHAHAPLPSRPRVVQLWDVQNHRLLRKTSADAAPTADSLLVCDRYGAVVVVTRSFDPMADPMMVVTAFSLGMSALQPLRARMLPPLDSLIRRLARSTTAGRCEVWDLASGDVRARHYGSSAQLSPDQRFLLVPSSTIQQSSIIDMASGRLHLVAHGWPSGKGRSPNDLVFGPDGSKLVTRIDWPDGRIENLIWDLTKKTRVPLPADGSSPRAFSPDGKRFVTYALRHDAGIRVWDAASGALLRTISLEVRGRLPGAPHPPIDGLDFSPDGRHVAVRLLGEVRIANLETGSVYTAIPRDGHHGAVADIAVSPDGALLASAGEDRTVGLWRTEDGQYVGLLEGYQAPLRSLRFLPDGRLLTRDAQGALALWKIHLAVQDQRLTVKAEAQWQAESTGVGLALSTDGNLIATGGADGTVGLWSAADGKPIKKLEASGSGNIASLAFSADAGAVAAAGADGLVRLWDVTTGSLTASWDGGQGAIRALAFHPHGGLLATAGADIRLWDPATRQLLLVLNKHARSVRNVRFSSDGRMLVSGGEDETTIVWDVEQLRQAMEKMGLGWQTSERSSASRPQAIQ